MMEPEVKELLRKNNLRWADFQRFMQGKSIAGIRQDERSVPRATYWVDDVKEFVQSQTSNPVWQ